MKSQFNLPLQHTTWLNKEFVTFKSWNNMMYIEKTDYTVEIKTPISHTEPYVFCFPFYMCLSFSSSWTEISVEVQALNLIVTGILFQYTEEVAMNESIIGISTKYKLFLKSIEKCLVQNACKYFAHTISTHVTQILYVSSQILVKNDFLILVNTAEEFEHVYLRWASIL